MTKKIDVLFGTPGCGKSAHMIQSAASFPGRYIFAVPTINLIEEQARYFAKLNPSAKAIRIHSDNSLRIKVSRQIDDLLDEPAGGHLVAWITHESFLNNDFSTFSDWHARIDEPPNTIVTGMIKSIISLKVFQENFTLVPVPDSEWSNLLPKNPFGGWKKISGDVLWANLTDFLKLSERSSGVFIKAANWEIFGSGEPIEWLSYWPPAILEVFKTSQIAGSSYFNSLGYLASQSFAEKPEFNPLDLSTKPTHQPQIKIRYFTNSHFGSTTFWADKEGRLCIAKIGDWLNQYASNLGFWSGNEAVQNSLEHRISGQLVSPKLAGLNSFREYDSCAMIYSAKPQPHDALLYDIFDLTKKDVKLAREGEDIFQFVFRGAIRNPTFGGTYTIYLYSEDQAHELTQRFNEYGFFDISIEPVKEAGIMDFERSRLCVKKPLSQSQIETKEQKKREQGRLRVRKYRAKKKVEKTGNQDK